MTEPVNINAVPKLNLGLQETDEVFISRGGSGPYRVPASSFPWEQKGDKGDPGGSWAPVLSLVTDGVRRVHRIVGWVGGTGVEPTTTGYIGAAGIVSNVAEAVDVRGLQGNAGWSPVLALVADGDRRVHQVIDWAGGAGAKPGVGWYVGATGLVELIQDAVNVRGATGGVGWSPVLAVVPDGNRRVQQIVDWIGGAGTKPTALGYVGVNGIVATAAAAADVSGAQGNAGWAPVLAIVADGERRVQQVVDWVGGAGTKPAALGYIGSEGIVATAVAAVDVRGPQGTAGWTPVLAIVADGERRVQQVVDWTGGTGTKPTSLGYIGTAGIVATAAAAVDVRGSGVVSAPNILGALNTSQTDVLGSIKYFVSGGFVTSNAPPSTIDVLVYGAEPAGIMAAIRAAEIGASVVLVEPTVHLGGMMTSGIAKTDYRINAQYRAGMNGLTAELFREAGRLVGQDPFTAAYQDQWNYPCQTFDTVLRAMLLRRGVRVHLGWRLLDAGAAHVVGGDILSVTVTNGETQQVIRARQYINGYYHPDLGRHVGVQYSYGRDAAATYGEPQAGTTAANLTFAGVDPYITPSVPASGLLPGIANAPLPAVGSADPQGMWDCHRIVVTNDPALRLPFPEPVNYDKMRYELLGRWIVQGGGPQTLNAAITRYDIHEDAIPGLTITPGKMIENWNNTNISFNRPGGYPSYWNATWSQRQAMDQDLRDYTLGLIKWLKTDSRVPAAIKDELADWGMLAGEPYDSQGLPPLSYRRESGRMTSARYVVTRLDMTGSRFAPQPVAFGCYGWDIHFCGAWLDSGVIKIEGLVSGTPANRYGIDIGALLPQPTVVRNFIEAVCIGCSHIVWGSVRVEPTLMSIGEAAGVMAGLAVQRGAHVHGISAVEVRERVGMALHAPLGLIAPTGAISQTGVTQTGAYGTMTFSGQWDYEAAPIGWPDQASGCFHDRGSSKGSKIVTYTPNIEACGGAGTYEVYITAPAKHSADLDDSPSVPVTVNANGATYSLMCDFLRGDWVAKLLGVYRFSGSGAENVIISNAGTIGRLRVCAVEFRRVGP